MHKRSLHAVRRIQLIFVVSFGQAAAAVTGTIRSSIMEHIDSPDMDPQDQDAPNMDRNTINRSNMDHHGMYGDLSLPSPMGSFYPDQEGVINTVCELCGISIDYCAHALVS
jgi:hypothetical protein